MTVDYAKKCSSATEHQINTSILYASLLHGSLFAAYFPLDVKILLKDTYEYECESCFKQHIQLDLDELRCNPSCYLTSGVLSGMFSWVCSFLDIKVQHFVNKREAC